MHLFIGAGSRKGSKMEPFSYLRSNAINRGGCYRCRYPQTAAISDARMAIQMTLPRIPKLVPTRRQINQIKTMRAMSFMVFLCQSKFSKRSVLEVFEFA